MAQRSYFFDSVAGDRIYTSADFARVFGALAGRDGVIYGYGDELKVTPGTGMNVTVGTGAAFVQGRMLEVYGQAETLPIATADATNPRIDRVVVRVDLSTAQRKAYLAVKTGTAAATPVAPLLQQDSTIWELSLAQVRVGAGATGIVVEDITDEREYTSLATDRLLAHLADTNNPHQVTAAQLGLGDVLTNQAQILGSRIVEMSSNSNGTYVRWENGLQICFVRGGAFTGDGTSDDKTGSWTHPAAFASVPTIVGRNAQDGASPSWHIEVNPSLDSGGITITEVTWRAYRTSGSWVSGRSYPLHYIAIGRWK